MLTGDDIKKLTETLATKEDLQALPTAEMVNKSFQTLTDTVNAGFASVNARFDYANARLATIERDVKDIIHREEFDDLMARVKYLEQKMGIQSGR